MTIEQHIQNQNRFNAIRKALESKLEAEKSALLAQADEAIKDIPRLTITNEFGTFTFSICVSGGGYYNTTRTIAITGQIEPYEYDREHKFAGMTLKRVSVVIAKRWNAIDFRVEIGSTDTNITTIRMNKICALFPEDQIQAIWNELEPHFDKAYYAQHLRDLAYEIRTFPLANYCFDGQREQDKKVHEELMAKERKEMDAILANAIATTTITKEN